MRRLAEERGGVRVDTPVDDDFAPLAEAFNAMSDKLGATLDEMRETRDYLEGIVESSADIIIVVNPQGSVYTFNRGAEAALGYSRNEVIGRSVERLFSDPHERTRAIKRLRGVENVVDYETHLLTKDGEVRDVTLTLSRLRDASGQAIGMFGIGRDTTEANRMREKLLHAEKFAAIGQAVAGIQHALKNMLNALKGGAYMVGVGLSKDRRPLLEEGWGMVKEGIENLTAMSTHMLKYVKNWKLELERVDLGTMVREIEGVFRTTMEDRGVGLRVEIPSDLPLVQCDARLVHSAVMDILSNAVDACLEKVYPEDETPEIRIALYPSEGDARFVLAVRDNGCGMSPQVRANVFTPFFSTKKSSGTGLGLALTARTIRLHGGEIEVESQPNEGSEFRIIVPTGGPET